MTASTEVARPIKSLIPARMDGCRGRGSTGWSSSGSAPPGSWTAWRSRSSPRPGSRPDLDMTAAAGRPRRHRLPARRGRRRAGLRPAHRHPRPQEALHHDPGGLPVGAGLAGLSPEHVVPRVFRFIAGMGIGGEYSAINSAIDELIPGKYRGRVDLAINGTYWAGASSAPSPASDLLDTDRFAENIGWRIAFFIGPVLGLVDHLPAPAHPGEPSLDGHPRPAPTRPRRSSPASRSEVRAQGKQLPQLDESGPCWIKAREGDRRQAAVLRLLQALPDPDGPRPDADDHPVASSTTRSSSPTRWCCRTSTA